MCFGTAQMKLKESNLYNAFLCKQTKLEIAVVEDVYILNHNNWRTLICLHKKHFCVCYCRIYCIYYTVTNTFSCVCYGMLVIIPAWYNGITILWTNPFSFLDMPLLSSVITLWHLYGFLVTFHPSTNQVCLCLALQVQ